MQEEEIIIIGAGPCGLSTALAFENYNIKPLIIEKGCIVNTISKFPTHQTFFSSSHHLEIGNFPFVTERHKPVRNEALNYYREVASRNQLRINSYEKVTDIRPDGEHYIVATETHQNDKKTYKAGHIILATGYYDNPNYLHVPGESLDKVSHYFKEAHPYYDQKVVIIGGKNSAIDAALELEKAGAHVTVLYRGHSYSKSVKPWILPQFDSLIRHEKIKMEFKAHVTEITDHHVNYTVDNLEKTIENDFVFAMTGYEPNLSLLKSVGIDVDEETARPTYNEDTYETNMPNVYLAGVVISGFNTSETFIENGRLHGEKIAKSILNK